MVLSMDRWHGKVAIVTGSTAGIGKAVSEFLVNEGVHVAGFARREEKNKELAKHLEGKKGKFYPVKVDVTKEDEIKNGFKWVTENVGPVHILVNNAGILLKNTLVGGDTDKWRKVFDTNILGLCICTKEAIEIMKTNKIDGHIIFINSVTGHKVIGHESNVYAASKHAVTALTETFRLELVSLQSKIKVTSISPGFVDTDILQAGGNAEIRELIKDFPSLKGEDIADAVQYVLSTPPHVQIHELMIKPVGESF